MINRLIEQEIRKFNAESFEIENRLIENDQVIYLLPNQFAIVEYFQVKSNDSVFDISVFSDDKKINYTEKNCIPIQDPLGSRYFAASHRMSIHRGFIQSQKKALTTEEYFINYYLVNTYLC
ncbi:hypothetical protein [Chondrinema litorale]|uniref:hypothetical protein n=1 Tax=Chondrinema litorale TaxID=2994555 RepID=UPI000C47B661|nr:hypothetical protein [Chondrinema litorale]MBT29825.1 hypothetical protein [Thalassovita sp.]UZR95321.1 hypothetical protein OQ292_05740 [Chondrinema litorale]